MDDQHVMAQGDGVEHPRGLERPDFPTVVPDLSEEQEAECVGDAAHRREVPRGRAALGEKDRADLALPKPRHETADTAAADFMRLELGHHRACQRRVCLRWFPEEDERVDGEAGTWLKHS